MRTTSSWLAALAAAVAMMLVVGPALAFNANTVPNLTVWLKADAGVLTNSSGVVTTWLDQSGNGHNGANSLASSPTNPKYTNSAAQLGSQPALVFTHDGTGITLGNLGSSFPSAATLFVVASINDAGYNIFITKDSQTWWRYSGNGYAYPGAFRAGRIETYAIEPSTGAYIFQVESSASNWRMLTNGVSQGNYAASYSGGDNYRIGYGPDAGGFSGQIAEVLVYSRILSSNEQNQVGSYLAWKYSLPTTYPALPIISNRDATNVTATTATLQGTLLSTGTMATAVSVYWGPVDGGTNVGAWVYTNAFGICTASLPADIATNVTLPDANTVYFYTYAASNGVATVLEQPSKSLEGTAVWMQKISDASEAGLVPGTCMVYRASSATNGALSVNYGRHVDSTATSGVDYVALSGSVVIPAGATNAPIVVTPLADWLRQSDSTLKLELLSGGYIIGAPGDATLTITNAPIPGAPTNTWTAAAAGNASVAGNWSLGHMPTSSEIVLLGGYSVVNMTWDVAATNTVASWMQTSDYSGTVTFGTVYAAGSLTNVHITGNATINGGTWTHRVNAGSQTYCLNVTVDGDLSVSNASINVDSIGYDGSDGPGKAVSWSGGTYGGIGGDLNFSGSDPNQNTYGSITAPTDLGSGSGSGSSGGGAIILHVGGSTTLINGSALSALGNNAIPHGSGAGGSIFLTTASITGTGAIRANGAATGDGSGGGGRIAVVLTGAGATFANFSGPITAYGGSSSTPDSSGAAGTVYLKTAADNGTLIINNNNNPIAPGYVDTLIPTGVVLSSFSSIIITNGGILGITSNHVADLNTLVLQGGGCLHIRSDALVTYPANWTISGYSVWGDGISKALTNVTVASGCSLGHARNSGTSFGEKYKLNLTILGNLTVQSNAQINADACGYRRTSGPGAATSGWSAGGYGGYGADYSANCGGPTYGYVLAPTNIGSGGQGSYAGGSIILHVAGTTTIATGAMVSVIGIAQNQGSGSGGSIFLTTSALTGGGTIRANGGAGNAGAGGGGRVALVLTGPGQDFSGFTGPIVAYGGDYTDPKTDGAAGTVYKQTLADGAGAGTVKVDNNNLDAATGTLTRTSLPPTASSTEILKSTQWTVQNKGFLNLRASTQIKSLTIANNAWLDLVGKTLTVKTLTITNKTYAAGTYAAAPLGVLVADSVGGGSVVVLGLDRGTAVYFH